MEIEDQQENKEEEIIRPTTPTAAGSATGGGSGNIVTTPGNNNTGGNSGTNVSGITNTTTSTTATSTLTLTGGSGGTIPSTSSSMTAENSTSVVPSIDENNQNNEVPQILELRDPLTRPVYRLSVKLIDTYKHINKVYYEAKARKIREQQGSTRVGLYNDGYDDQNYDYIIHGDEMFAERYILKHRIGKGSFGQVVCAYDRQTQTDVAIKIIKSKHAFMVQARTEIKLLELAGLKDRSDDQNIVRLLDTFVFRKHQCLVFEMLSYNLYELLKNTKFRGVSLSLVRKFAKQILKGLEFLAREDVDIIHCDLKPENILLRHPKRSAIKIIDFGSSCLSTKKTYTYIQSRFYRSPEVLLGLPYSQKIDIWSLGCVLVEMHTGEPLFGGVDQLDQLNRIVSVMGMIPPEMIAASPVETRNIFFEKVDPPPSTSPVPTTASGTATASSNSPSTTENPTTNPTSNINPDRIVTIIDPATNQPLRLALKMHKSEIEAVGRKKDTFRKKTLEEIIGVETGGPQGRRLNDPGHTTQMYATFVDFIRSMLIYQPNLRTTAVESLKHSYLQALDNQPEEKQEDMKQGDDQKSQESGRNSTESKKEIKKDDTVVTAAPIATSTTATAAAGTTTTTTTLDTKPLPMNTVSTQSSNQSPPRRRSLSAPRLTSTGSSTSSQSTAINTTVSQLDSSLKSTVGIESQVQQISVSSDGDSKGEDKKQDLAAISSSSTSATTNTTTATTTHNNISTSSTSSMNNPCA